MLNRGIALFVAVCFGLGFSIIFIFFTNARPEGREGRPAESPRTSWSSSNAAQRHHWYAWHTRLKKQASEEVLPAASNRTRLIFVGDSIFERLLGSSLGQRLKEAHGYPGIL